MRYLFLALLLTSCVPDRYWSPQEPEVRLQSSKGQKDSVAWMCGESQLNDKLVWVECQFYNRSTIRTADSVCVEVGYIDIATHTEVEHSRKVCSGVLTPLEVNSNYAAFIKKQREKLINVCNIDNSNCLMNISVQTK